MSSWADLGPVSWRPMTVKWRQSNRHSTIGTRQTEYHEALPSSANDEVRCDCTFADDVNDGADGVFFCFCFFAFPSYISGVHHYWVRFLRMWPFFYPTIKVVTFRLRGWCVLGVFFVAGIHPSRTWTSGSFESVRWNACVHRLDLGLYSHPKEFWGEWSLNPC